MSHGMYMASLYNHPMQKRYIVMGTIIIICCVWLFLFRMHMACQYTLGFGKANPNFCSSVNAIINFIYRNP